MPTIPHMLFWTLAAHCRLDRERQSKDLRSMHGFKVLRRNFAVVISPSWSPIRRQKPAWKVALSTFPQHHVLPSLMCLRQVTCPSCFPSQMKNLGMTIELDPKGDKIRCPAFCLHSSRAEYSTVGRAVLDLTNLAYQQVA